MNLIRSFVVRSLCGLALPIAAAAGQLDRAPTLDLGVEGWGGYAEGRGFSNDTGLGANATLTWRAASLPHGAILVGGGAGYKGTWPFERCVIAPGQNRPGCAPDYPSFSSLTAYAGLEGSFGATLRVLGGPGVFRSGATGTAAGLQGRADLATPAVIHAALFVFTSGTWLPNVQGRTYRMGALGVGVRIR